MKQINKKFLSGVSRLIWRDTARLLVVSIVMVVITQPALAQPPTPVELLGIATYENGSYVPDGWNVCLENLDESFVGEPWTTETGSVPPIYNYRVAGLATTRSTFKIDVRGDNYIGSRTFETNPGTFLIINITVLPTGITPIPTPPSVTKTPPPTPTGHGGAPPTPIEEVKTYKNIAAGEEVKVELLGKELKITFKKGVPEAKITAKEFVEKPADVPDAPGIVFKYLEYNIENVSPEDIGKITIPFDVPKTWIASENIDPATIKLNRYYNGVWNPLPTEKVSEDAEYIHYSAEAEGLSIFAITGEKKTEVPLASIRVVICTVLLLLVITIISIGVWHYKKRK